MVLPHAGSHTFQAVNHVTICFSVFIHELKVIRKHSKCRLIAKEIIFNWFLLFPSIVTSSNAGTDWKLDKITKDWFLIYLHRLTLTVPATSTNYHHCNERKIFLSLVWMNFWPSRCEISSIKAKSSQIKNMNHKRGKNIFIQLKNSIYKKWVYGRCNEVVTCCDWNLLGGAKNKIFVIFRSNDLTEIRLKFKLSTADDFSRGE